MRTSRRYFNDASSPALFWGEGRGQVSRDGLKRRAEKELDVETVVEVGRRGHDPAAAAAQDGDGGGVRVRVRVRVRVLGLGFDTASQKPQALF